MKRKVRILKDFSISTVSYLVAQEVKRLKLITSYVYVQPGRRRRKAPKEIQ
jgi:hypothetical protein